MNRKFNPIIAVGAVLLLIGVAVLAVLATKGGSDSKKVRALVATADIAAGTLADKAPIKVEDVPANQVPAGSPIDLTSLAGKVAAGKIPAGQVISAISFQSVSAAIPTGVSLHAGKQAIGVELGFAPGILRYAIPGNHINIFASAKPVDQPNGTIQLGTSRPLLTDILVLRTTPGAGDGNGTPVTPGSGSLDFLLEVDQSQAQTLLSALVNPTVGLYFTLSKTSTS